MTGLSRSNLNYMRSFAEAWPPTGSNNAQIVPQPVGQLPWGHIRCLIDKLDSPEQHQWYASQALENGWSRSVLEAQITTDLKGRLGEALTSFDHTLPAPDSELVRDAIKDPYNFEFLALSREAQEHELERQPGDEPTIGLILCPGRGKTVTEWALRGIDTPLAVARYVTGDVTLTETPPPDMQPALPDLPALASELTNIVEAANTICEDDCPPHLTSEGDTQTN